MSEEQKQFDHATIWANVEIQAVNAAIVIVAHYNKLVAEGMDEYKAWELTQSLAERIYGALFPKQNPY
jgi:hypothetical protein